MAPISGPQNSAPQGAEQSRRNRRTALWLLGVALCFYVGFILMSVTAAHK